MNNYELEQNGAGSEYNKHPMQELIEMALTIEEGRIGDELLDHNRVNKEVLKTFLDIAMPAVSKSSFKNCAPYEELSDLVTQSEEAFAFLVFENNFSRWMFNAKREFVDNGGILRGVDAGKEEDYRLSEMIPDTRYQINCKSKKDQHQGKKAGRWTEKGFERYNELLSKVSVARRERREGSFEEDLQAMYSTEVELSGRKVLQRLNMKKEGEVKTTQDKNGTAKRVTVTNVLEFL